MHRNVKRVRLVLAAFLLFNLGGSVVAEQLRRFAMRAYRIPSSAMEPTLHCARSGTGCDGETNDRILVVRFAPFWAPSRGDIIAFDAPPEAGVKCGARGTFVKRLIGLPGETITEKSGIILVNGKRLREAYVEPRRRDTSGGSWKVAKGTYFFMGDNRASSCDSRIFGSVPRDNLVGPVVARYWPFDRFGLL
jgi:signal peptidase I